MIGISWGEAAARLQPGKKTQREELEEREAVDERGDEEGEGKEEGDEGEAGVFVGGGGLGILPRKRGEKLSFWNSLVP